MGRSHFSENTFSNKVQEFLTCVVHFREILSKHFGTTCKQKIFIYIHVHENVFMIVLNCSIRMRILPWQVARLWADLAAEETQRGHW